MSKEKKNEIVVKEKHEVQHEMASMFDTSLSSSGDDLEAKDLRIPKLVQIQGMTKSSFNTANAPVGHYINSIEKNDLGENIEIFVMNDTKLWELKYDVVQGKKTTTEYLGTIEYTHSNSDLRKNPRIPLELAERAAEKGVTVESISQINEIVRLTVLIVSEVLEGAAFPYMVDFKRSSLGNAINFKNAAYRLKTMKGIPSYGMVYTLGSEFIQDEYDYFVKTLSKGRMITPQEIGAVEHWVREMMNNREAYSVDESSEGEEINKEGAIESTATVINEEGNPKF